MIPAISSPIANDVKRAHAQARQAKVLALHVAKMTRLEIAKSLGVTERTVYRDLEAIQDNRVEVDELIEDACITAEDAHLKLTKAFDSRIQELFDDEWNMLPRSKWPEPFKSWGLLTEIKVEDVMIQDADGDGATWKKSGGKRVTVKGPDVLKTIELAMKHKAVDGMVQQKAGDVNVQVSGEVVNLAQIFSLDELQSLRQRAIAAITPDASGNSGNVG